MVKSHSDRQWCGNSGRLHSRLSVFLALLRKRERHCISESVGHRDEESLERRRRQPVTHADSRIWNFSRDNRCLPYSRAGTLALRQVSVSLARKIGT